MVLTLQKQRVKRMPSLLSKALSATVNLCSRCVSLSGYNKLKTGFSKPKVNKTPGCALCRLLRLGRTHRVQQNRTAALDDSISKRMSEIVIKAYNSGNRITVTANEPQEDWEYSTPVRGRFVSDNAFVKSLNSICQERYANSDYTVEMMSMDMGMSHSMLYATMMRLRQVTPSAYIEEQRFKMALNLLHKSPMLNDIEIADMTGFKTVTALHRCFSKRTGKSIEQFRCYEIRNKRLAKQ